MQRIMIAAALVAFGAFGYVGCNKKSEKKSGSAANPTPTPTVKPTVDPGPKPTPTPSITGYTCQTSGLIGGEEKTIIIDTSSNRMRITAAGGQQDYTLTPEKPSFLAPKYLRFSVAVVGSGTTEDNGTVAIDQDTKSPIGRDNGGYVGFITKVPYSLTGGEAKTLNAKLNCQK